MRKRWRVLGVFGVLAWGAASAEGLLVRASDLQGRPVVDAVVTIQPRSVVPTPARRAPQLRTIDQKNLMFVPYIQMFRPGDSVVFRNSDGTRHHVYSFSPAKAFEFVLAPGQSSPPMTLSNSGVIAVGCNIHDQMASYLVVSDAPWTATTGSDGRALLATLPPGVYDVQAWHPRLRPGRRNVPLAQVTVSAGATATLAFPLALLPDTRMQHDREHVQY
jgi:plastocyanin